MIADRANPLVLVTGGAGFIGSHLCEALLMRGARVRVLDDFSTGRWENLARIHSDIEVIEGGLESASAVEWTATVPMPNSRQARITRSAISPRLATRILLNIGGFTGGGFRASSPDCDRACRAAHRAHR